MGRVITPDDLKAKREIEVLVPHEKVKALIDKVAQEYRRSVTVRGFRPGKAPIEVIKLRFGSEIEEEAKNRAVEEAILEKIKELALEPISKIRIVEETPDDEGIRVRAEFEVLPKFEFPEVSGIKVRKVVKKVTDSEVEEELERLRKRMAEYYPVDREAREGDYIFVDYEERDKDGKVLERRNNVYIPLIWDEIDRTLFEHLKGRKAGEVVQIERRLVVEGGEELDRVYVYKINSIREEKLPPIDESMAQLAGFSSLEELKKKIKEELAERKKKESEDEFEENIINSIYERINFEIPESLVEDELNYLKGKYPTVASQPGGEDFLRNLAIQAVKRRIILERFAEKANIEVKDEEVDEEIKELALELKVKPDEYKKHLRKRGGLEGIKGYLRRKKAMEMLKSLVKMEVIFE